MTQHRPAPAPVSAMTTDQTAIPRPSVAPKFHPRQRFLRVSGFLLGVIAHAYFWDIFLARFALTRWYARRTAQARWVNIARRFRMMAVELGGMQIKLGQFLSSRADIIPQAVRYELAGLQDEVPPAPAGHVLEVIIEELGAPPSELFRCFAEEAVAAASLGQVHFATLHDGREVAVKVQRPYIDKIIEVDLSAVAWVARMIKNYPPIKRRADLEALLTEFARVLNQELDYVQEARNAATFRANFVGVQGVYFPEVITDHTTRRVLVMERVGGVKINDWPTLERFGVSRSELATRLNDCYLKQFFIDGFFHADPHPGNLFVRIDPELPSVRQRGQRPTSTFNHNGALADGHRFGEAEASAVAPGRPFTLIFVDFGMTGALPPQSMEIIRRAVVGLATSDAERIVDAIQQLNMILPGADRQQIVRAIEILLRHAFNRTMRQMSSIDVEALFAETKEIVYDLPFQIPQDLLYFGRSLSMVAGLATELCPDINLFQELQPFALKLLDEERRNGNWPEQVQKELREMGQILLTLPRQMNAYYKAANRGEISTRSDLSRLERGMRRVERSNERLTGGMLATGLFLGGVELHTHGLTREASRAWWAAAAAALWAVWPRHER